MITALSTLAPATLAVFGLGTTEIVVIFFILLVLFGASLLPRLARGLGETVKELRAAARPEDPIEPADDRHAESGKS